MRTVLELAQHCHVQQQQDMHCTYNVALINLVLTLTMTGWLMDTHRNSNTFLNSLYLIGIPKLSNIMYELK